MTTFAMLQFRSDQIQTFHQALLKPFVDRMASHLGEFFPDQCEALGEAKLRLGIWHGIERAEGHGFSSERDLCKYLNLSFTFGRDFDTDPDLPWAAEILALQGLPPKKMDRLYQQALKHTHEGQGFLYCHTNPPP